MLETRKASSKGASIGARKGLVLNPPEMSSQLTYGDEIDFLNSRYHFVDALRAVAIQDTVQPQHHVQTSVATQ